MRQVTRRCVFMALCTVLSMVCGCGDKPASADFSERELAVIQEFLASQMPVGDDLFLHLKARTTDRGISAGSERRVLFFGTQSLSSARNFLQVNQERSAFQLDGDNGHRVRIVCDDELRRIFKEGGWGLYYERYPKSHGIAEISRVGFSDNGDEALLFFIHNYGRMAGHGTYVLLRLQDGAWVVEDTYRWWVS